MNVVRRLENGNITYQCPGCGDTHTISLEVWTWNGNKTHPTFAPSVLVRSGHFSDRHKSGDHCWCTFYKDNPDVAANPENHGKRFECYRCHSFVRDGMVELLGDCSHANAGKTLPLLPFEGDGA